MSQTDPLSFPSQQLSRNNIKDFSQCLWFFRKAKRQNKEVCYSICEASSGEICVHYPDATREKFPRIFKPIEVAYEI